MTLKIRNNGIGPAIIKSVSIQLDGEEMANFDSLFVKLQGTARFPHVSSQVQNRVLPAGDSIMPIVIRDDIWAERRYELSGEGHRFFDLVRTGQAATSITGYVVGKHELFPLPQVEISLAGGNWSQNPGY